MKQGSPSATSSREQICAGVGVEEGETPAAAIE